MLCALNAEELVPAEHPIRTVKVLADAALERMSAEFDSLYSKRGRKSIPPEQLLKSMLLMALYSLRSERQFCEQLRYNLLFRWFLDMDMTGETFDHSTFTNNRDRFLGGDLARKLFSQVVDEAKRQHLMSREHFSVDGTLIEAWASMKSFRPTDDDDDGDGNGWSEFKGSKRKNDTHQSRTDPESRLTRKGKGREAKLCFSAHALMENRNGLLVDFDVSQSTGTCEREVALQMLGRHKGNGRITVGADAGYGTKDFIAQCQRQAITPHVAVPPRNAPLDGRTSRHEGFAVSQRVRRRIEQVFGWMKSSAGMRKSRYIGVAKTSFSATMTAAAYNLLRMSRFMEVVADT